MRKVKVDRIKLLYSDKLSYCDKCFSKIFETGSSTFISRILIHQIQGEKFILFNRHVSILIEINRSFFKSKKKIYLKSHQNSNSILREETNVNETISFTTSACRATKWHVSGITAQLNDRGSLREDLFRTSNLVTLRMSGRSRGWSCFIELRTAS